MKVEILSVKTKEVLLTLDDISIYTTVGEIKTHYQKVNKKLYPARQALRKELRGPVLSDDETIGSLKFEQTARFYFKDLGPQIAWKTVFLTEYSGPLLAYLFFYIRPNFIYGVSTKPMHKYAHIACACFVFHFAKRLLETLFIHRFSHGTMPIANIFKNTTYYAGFAGFVAYFINHPLYTPASNGDTQLFAGLFGFLVCEFGNYSIHVALRSLRPEGTKERRIPVPTSNPFTWLFHLVSCPNYTYEFGSWFFFTIMTQALPSALFTAVGTAQMAAWAIKKQRNYRKEFKDYPRGRKAMFPFFL